MDLFKNITTNLKIVIELKKIYVGNGIIIPFYIAVKYFCPIDVWNLNKKILLMKELFELHIHTDISTMIFEMWAKIYVGGLKEFLNNQTTKNIMKMVQKQLKGLDVIIIGHDVLDHEENKKKKDYLIEKFNNPEKGDLVFIGKYIQHKGKTYKSSQSLYLNLQSELDNKKMIELENMFGITKSVFPFQKQCLCCNQHLLVF